MDEVKEDIRISEDEVHSLLAFAYYTQNPDVYKVSEKRTLLSQEKEPRNYSTKPPWRIAKCLDSLANMCLSGESDDEVISIAIRYGNEYGQKILEFFIAATAEDVPDTTVNHFERIWDLLRQISTQKYDVVHENAAAKKDCLANLVGQINLAVIKFTFSRIQKILFTKFKRFDSRDSKCGLDEKDKEIKGIVLDLERILRKNGKDKPPSAITDNDWKGVSGLLYLLSAKIFKHYPKGEEDTIFLSYIRYLHNMAEIAGDINRLTLAALSPRCRDIFSVKPRIIVLKAEQRDTSFLARMSTDAWKTQMQFVLDFYNSIQAKLTHFRQSFYEHSETISSRKELPQSTPVHCEIKLVLHLFTEDNNSNPSNTKPAAYPYIGVSNLSCLACGHFLSAFNQVHGTKYLTKGQGKRYFPWAFPSTCPKGNEILKRHYASLTAWFVPWYRGCGTEDSLVYRDLYYDSLIDQPSHEELDQMQREYRELDRRQYKKYNKRKLEDLIEKEEK